ncbi:MAG TPA: sigma-54-dependent Fis family transcriptional regulator, partial [Maribacter sp.]|nr:sigma-54-dependent Fis family transcriptional regulator [Maribacter sp.]
MDLRKENILIVDDDIDILELLQRHLQSMDYHTYKAVSVKEALFILKDTFIDLLITDIQMPEIDGLQLLKFASEHYPEIPKLVVTGYPSVEGTLEVIKSGATDYLTKPFTKSELNEAIDKALLQNTTRKKSRSISINSTSNIHSDMVGESTAFRKVTNIIERVKDNKATVIVTGESGTGKELVARAIHYSGKFSREPFIAVNCAAIPENLQEAELFGYMKGAFTGANENRNGFFQAAKGGTLFLDEIGTASLSVQTKLLRALQEKEITRVGSQKVEKVDIRIIAATNADLREEIKNNTFREDLYYRLTVVEINVPPLRERKSDISLLAEKFIRKYGIEFK